MSPFLVGLLLVVAGLAGLFFGYRIFRVILPIFGGIAGYLIAAALFPNNLFLALVIGFGLAVVLAIVAYAAWSLMVTISGAILGGSVGAAIAEGLRLWSGPLGTLLGWIIVIALGVVGAILVWKIRDEVVIILTAITGAGFIADGLRQWFPAWNIEGFLWTVIFIVLAVIGIVWQWRRYRHLGLLAFGGPAEKPGAKPAAAPAPAEMAPDTATRAAPAVPIESAPVAAVAAVTAATVAVAATAEAEPPAAEIAAPALEAAVPVVAAEAAVVAASAGAEPPVTEAAVAANLAQLEATFGGSDLTNLREKVEFIEGVEAADAAKLNAAGIVTVVDLLRRGATRKGRAELAAATGIAAGLILTWVNHADLFRIKGVGKQFGELLEAAGVDTVVELAHRSPANLYTRLVEVNTEKKLAGRSPRQDEVNNWVAQAKGLPRGVEY